jgi:polysaccharide export outer membrane protein
LVALYRRLLMPALGVALSLSGVACDPQPPMTANTLQQPSQVTQTIRMAEYRVAPGDRLRVVVLSDPELSGEYEVD